MRRQQNARQDRESSDLAARVAAVQGGYYLLTGLWPLIHPRSFEWITGPKVDRWLVKTVGALTAAIGAGLGLAARRQRVTPELVAIGVGSAAGLAAVDAVYVGRRRISPVYLLDAAGQMALGAGWLAAARRGGLQQTTSADVADR